MNAPTLIAADKIAFVTFSVALALQEIAREAVATRYTAGEVLTFFAAGGVLLTGLGAVIVNIIVALKSGTKLDASLAKTDALSGQVKEVHTLTNSNLSAVKAELSTVISQNTALHELVADLRGERDKAALTAAALAPSGGTGTAQPVLAQIETNTDATAKNTATTKADVKELKEQA